MITVTAATGHLGRLVVADLLDRGVPANEITAAVRTPEKAADLGVRVVEADYDRPETLAPAFAGTDRLLFISGSEAGARLRQHHNVIDAARAANVGLIAYTSIYNASGSSLKLAAEHQATEEAILASGLPYVFLRNGWYVENYTGQVEQAVANGVLLGAAGDGKVSAATRADFAAAAAAVLVDPVPGSVYELGGDEAFTLPELAAEISRQTGTPVEYRNLPEGGVRADARRVRDPRAVRGDPRRLRPRHRGRRAVRRQRRPAPPDRPPHDDAGRGLEIGVTPPLDG